MRLRALAFFIISLLAGCIHTPAEPDRPALISNPSETTRRELQRVVSEALHGIPVELADSALTSSDRLIIERKQHLDPQGNPVMGRSMETPHHFNLIKNGNDCLLVNAATGQRWRLPNITCREIN